MAQRGPCYYCGGTSTSDEHVPPKSFFPKPADAQGLGDFRKNLVTVDSCDAHNTDTSKDDEYVATVLGSLAGTGIAGQIQTIKFQRMAKDRRGVITRLAADYVGRLHTSTEGLLGVDVGRLNRIFEKIARGVYFHEKSTIIPDDFSYVVIYPGIVSLDVTLLHDWKKFFRALKDLPEEKWIPANGFKNPDVFSAYFLDIGAPPILHFVIYGVFDVFAVPVPVAAPKTG